MCTFQVGCLHLHCQFCWLGLGEHFRGLGAVLGLPEPRLGPWYLGSWPPLRAALGRAPEDLVPR